MSYFKNFNDAKATTVFNFQNPAVGVQNYIRCKSGELAGWEYYRTDDAGNDLVKVYDKTSGTATLKAIVYTVAGCDIFRGLFSSGIIPTVSVLSANCVFYRLDYT